MYLVPISLVAHHPFCPRRAWLEAACPPRGSSGSRPSSRRQRPPWRVGRQASPRLLREPPFIEATTPALARRTAGQPAAPPGAALHRGHKLTLRILEQRYGPRLLREPPFIEASSTSWTLASRASARGSSGSRPSSRLPVRRRHRTQLHARGSSGSRPSSRLGPPQRTIPASTAPRLLREPPFIGERRGSQPALPALPAVPLAPVPAVPVLPAAPHWLRHRRPRRPRPGLPRPAASRSAVTSTTDSAAGCRRCQPCPTRTSPRHRTCRTTGRAATRPTTRCRETGRSRR